jgi:hypothetical protein
MHVGGCAVNSDPATSLRAAAGHVPLAAGHEALLDADAFEDLPGKWQAAILTAEQNRPQLRLVGAD